MADFKFSTIFTANNKDFVQSTAKMKRSMKGLNTSFKSGEKDVKSYFSKLRKHDNAFSKMSKDANRASGSVKGFGKAFTAMKGLLGVTAVYKAAQGIYMLIESAKDMVETANLFNVAMGSMAVSTDEFVQEFTGLTGLDVTNLRESVATFSLLARSMGIADTNAQTLSTNTAKLALDLSSLTNVPIQQVMQDLRSGLVGQSETVYKYGIDVTEASLKTEALNQGISKSVRTMSQGEKMALRYSVMIRQTSLAQGDFTKTIETPANQLRILKERLVTASRAMGTMFIPMLGRILPYANAITIVFTRMADAIAKVFGYEAPAIEDTMGSIGSGASDVADELDDASSSASKLKSTLMGFDEINLLPDATDSGGSGLTEELGGLGGYDLEGYDNGMDSITSKADGLADKIQEALASFSSLFSEVDPTDLIESLENLKVSLKPFTQGASTTFKWFIDNILVPLTTWTVNELLPTGINTLATALGELQKLLGPLGGKLAVLWEKYLGPAVTNIGDGIITGLEKIAEWFVDLGLDSDELSSDFDEMFESFKSNYDTYIKPTLDNWANEFSTFIEDSVRPFGESFTELGETINEATGGASIDFAQMGINMIKVFSLIPTFLKSLVTNIIAMLVQAIPEINTFLEGFVHLLHGTLTLSFEETIEGLRLMFIGFSNILASIANAVLNIVVDLANNIIGQLNPLLSKMGIGTLGTLGTIDLRLDKDLFKETYIPTYDPSAQYRKEENGIEALLNNLSGTSTAEPISFLEQNQALIDLLESTGNNNQSQVSDTPQEVVIKMDSTEVARATLPKLNREATRQGFETILKSK